MYLLPLHLCDRRFANLLREHAMLATLQENFSLSAQKAMYRESEIRRHFPEAWIDGYEDLIPAMTNHPKDRHVLAAQK